MWLSKSALHLSSYSPGLTLCLDQVKELFWYVSDDRQPLGNITIILGGSMLLRVIKVLISTVKRISTSKTKSTLSWSSEITSIFFYTMPLALSFVRFHCCVTFNNTCENFAAVCILILNSRVSISCLQPVSTEIRNCTHKYSRDSSRPGSGTGIIFLEILLCSTASNLNI
jgi:hypothetical protein